MSTINVRCISQAVHLLQMQCGPWQQSSDAATISGCRSCQVPRTLDPRNSDKGGVWSFLMCFCWLQVMSDTTVRLGICRECRTACPALCSKWPKPPIWNESQPCKCIYAALILPDCLSKGKTAIRIWHLVLACAVHIHRTRSASCAKRGLLLTAVPCRLSRCLKFVFFLTD